MHRHLFFLDATLRPGEQLALPAEEARHIARVLRFGPGEAITLTDGQGRLAEARLVEVTRESATVEIESVREAPSPPLPAIHLLLPWMKQPARMETAIEKATELGVERVTVFGAPPQAAKRLERWRRLVIAAAKQSGAARLVDVQLSANPPWECAEEGLRLLLSEKPAAEPLRAHFGGGPPAECAIAVGPEEGFTPEEESAAERAGWRRASLGPRRLRTETAALAAVAAVRALCDQREK